MQNRYVGLPKTAAGKTIKTYLFKANRSTKLREVLWGDFLKVTGESADGWLEIEWAAGRDSVEKSFIPRRTPPRRGRWRSFSSMSARATARC
ncbi:hypothetical protein [Mesorhizobium sp. 10J20-29]